jgi:hypothetical protein
MADTFGGIIDKLITADLKMWNNQELLYEIRKMTFDEYKNKYFSNEKGAEKLWKTLKKATDLNIQRNELIDELDERLIQLLIDTRNGKNLDNGKNIQRKHKTY